MPTLWRRKPTTTTMNNTFGDIYRITSFGESHGPAMGGVVDGMPPGLKIDFDALSAAMRRRRPGSSRYVSQRRELDEVKILSGVFDGVTTGAPIAFMVENADARPTDYEALRNVYRPSHADYTYDVKYGGVRDYRGGGRSSARETLTRVVAGELARQALAPLSISVDAFTLSVGKVGVCFPQEVNEAMRHEIESNEVRCPNASVARQIKALISDFAAKGDTLGGTVGCMVSNLPAGLGDPVYGKLQARLAWAMMSIPAAKGFDYGMGFDGVANPGSEMADYMVSGAGGGVKFMSNHSGGVQGGISNGEPLWFRVAFKPVATMMRDIATVDSGGNNVVLKPRGRHDVCVVPRAVPVVEAMAWIVIFDAWLKNLTVKALM